MKHNKSRVESFSDAVFAFAATLIVVSFEVPEDYSALRELMTDFISFAISFFVLLLIWKVHYNYFRRIKFVDNWIIGINSVLLFVILFYVYPMKFIANTVIGKSRLSSFEDLGNLFTIYGIGFVLIFSCITLLYYYGANKTNHLEDKKILRFYTFHYSFFIVVGVLSIILAFFNIGTRFGFPGFTYALLGPICTFYGIKYFPKEIE